MLLTMPRLQAPWRLESPLVRLTDPLWMWKNRRKFELKLAQREVRLTPSRRERRCLILSTTVWTHRVCGGIRTFRVCLMVLVQVIERV